jgi:hypothetical protein
MAITSIEISDRDLDAMRRHVTDSRASFLVSSPIDLLF